MVKKHIFRWWIHHFETSHLVTSLVLEEFRRADGEHRTRLAEYEQVHNDREEMRGDKPRWKLAEWEVS